jgi:hypothetical protein
MMERDANACLGAVRGFGLIGTCREQAVGQFQLRRETLGCLSGTRLTSL